jgi:PIN domain nuclease of toxin-antitoxin system
MIKSMKGTLEVGDPRHWFRQTLAALELQILLYRPEHIAALFVLPPVHNDPFDRALIAQATAEDLTLLTTDATIPKYASADFRVMR